MSAGDQGRREIPVLRRKILVDEEDLHVGAVMSRLVAEVDDPERLRCVGYSACRCR
jgi:hypothetical protein